MEILPLIRKEYAMESSQTMKLRHILENRFTLTPLPLSAISPVTLDMESENVLHSHFNPSGQLSTNDLNFLVYKIERTQKSELYFSEKQGQFANLFLDESQEPLLLVIIEQTTGYFSVNSSRLFLELDVEIGVTKEDEQNQTIRYQEFVLNKKILESKEQFFC